jgi:hypothetical protein
MSNLPPNSPTLQQRIQTNFLYTYQEIFESVIGVCLDKGTSLFETLDTISAEVASRPVGNKCATIAAQVDHVRFYIDVMIDYMRGQPPQNVDWRDIWNRVGAVTPEEWDAIRARLRESHGRVLEMIRNNTAWEYDFEVNAATAIVVHTAYHLGEIRQALCTVAG